MTGIARSSPGPPRYRATPGRRAMKLRTQPPAMIEALRTAVADLVDAVRQLEGLTGQVGPFALYSDACDRAPEVVIAVCQALNVPLTFDAPSRGRDRDFAVVALAAEIQRAQRSPELAGLRSEDVAAAAAE